MKNPVLIARSVPDETGSYEEMYMTGFRSGPAHGFIYRYDTSVGAEKNRVKVRLKQPLFIALLRRPNYWRLSEDPNILPSLWNPEDDSPLSEVIANSMREMFKNVRQ